MRGYSSFHPLIHQSQRIWRAFGDSLNSNHISGYLRQIREINVLLSGDERLHLFISQGGSGRREVTRISLH